MGVARNLDNNLFYSIDPRVLQKMQRRRMLTRAEEERLRAENRRKEYERVDHMKMVAQDKLLKANLASEERVEKKRFARR